MASGKQLELTEEQKAAWQAVVARNGPITLSAMEVDALLRALFKSQSAVFRILAGYYRVRGGEPRQAETNFDEAMDQAGAALDSLNELLKSLVVRHHG